MVRTKGTNITKESKFKKEYLYLILFVILGLFFLSLIGYTGMTFTTFTSLDISNSIKGAFDIFGQILTPLFQAIGEDRNGVFLRIFYWLFLFFIISGIEGLRKKFGADETATKRANIIAGLLALIAVIFTPLEFLILIGSSTFLFVVIGLILGGLYFIYNFQRGNENRFSYFIKAFLSFVLFILITTTSTYASSKFSSSLGVSSVFELVAGLGALISIVFFVWYLFIKTLMGSPTEEVETSPPSPQLKGAGKFYGNAIGEAAKGVGKGISAYQNWKQRRKQAKAQQAQPTGPGQQQTSSPPQVQKIRTQQQRQVVSLERQLSQNTTAAIIIINRFIRNLQNTGNWIAVSKILSEVINLGAQVKKANLGGLVRDFNTFESLRISKMKNPNDQSIDQRALNLVRNIKGDLVNIQRSLP